MLDRVDKPNARRLLSDLDISQPLGVRRVVPTRKSSAPPMYEFFLETKARHPLAVLLVRVSIADVISTIGSLLLCVYCDWFGAHPSCGAGKWLPLLTCWDHYIISSCWYILVLCSK